MHTGQQVSDNQKQGQHLVILKGPRDWDSSLPANTTPSTHLSLWPMPSIKKISSLSVLQKPQFEGLIGAFLLIEQELRDPPKQQKQLGTLRSTGNSGSICHVKLYWQFCPVPSTREDYLIDCSSEDLDSQRHPRSSTALSAIETTE